MSFIKITEQNSLYNDLERKSVRDLLEDINTEDQKVALAVRETIPKIEELVLQIVPRMKQGGRIFYLGAGTSGRLGVLDASEIPWRMLKTMRNAAGRNCWSTGLIRRIP